MPGRQAKVLSEGHVSELLAYARAGRYPARDAVMALASVKAGLRAGEIAQLDWDMVVDPSGGIATTMELPNRTAKRGSGRRIPLHAELRTALITLRAQVPADGAIVQSERGGRMRPISIVMWFARAYRELGFTGCSSHSGRRTFITRAARSVHLAGGSLRDVQLLAGHRSIQTTQRYIDGDTDAQRRLVMMI